MVGTVRGNVFTLKDAHVGGYVVVVTVAIGGCSREIAQRGKSPEVGDTVQFHIKALKPEIDRAWGEDVDPWC
jgi:hypothetical protein